MTTETLPSAKQKVSTIRDLVEKNRDQLKAALPRHLPVDRMLRVFFTALSINPKLYDCTPRSLLGALIQCAQLGLEPGILGHAYLVPFKNRKTNTTEVQFIPGYKGLVDLTRRSGEVSTVMAQVVRSKDHFKHAFGLNPVLEHTPSDQQDRGAITQVYAVIRLKDGGALFDVMSKGEVDSHRDRYSKAAQDGPWVTNYEEMAKKTVLRRVCKLAPVSVEAQQAIVLSEAAEQQLPQHLGDVIEMPAEPTEAEMTATTSALDQLADELQRGASKDQPA